MAKVLTLKSGNGKKARKADRKPVINKKHTVKVMSQATQTKAEKEAAEQAAAEAKQAMLQAAQSLVNFKVLDPFASCLVTIDQLPEAIAANYPEIYIWHNGKFFQHMQFKGGNDRHIRIQVDGLPKRHKAIEDSLKAMITDVQPSLNFLPAGKIPGEYWDQIVEFFRQVIKTKKANMEAHAWILWSEDKGYYISIPKQVVSGASVGYTWDAESVPQGSIVVVDVHSHNSMSAFYSGTDENDDKDKVYYTGVVGKITDETYEWVMRFNLREKKIKVTLEDLFEFQKEVQIPAEWLDQVEVRAPQTYKGKQGGFGAYIGGPKDMTPGSSPQNPAKWTSKTPSVFPTSQGGAGPRPGENTFPEQSSLWDYDGAFGHMGFMGYDPFTREVEEQLGGNASNDGESGGSQRSQEVRELLAGAPEGKGMKDDDVARLEAQAEKWFKDHNLDPETGEPLEKVTQGKGVILEDEEEPVGSRTPTARHYDEVEQKHGKDIAENYDLIDAILPELEGADKALIDIATSAYNLLSPEAQASLQTNGF